MSESELVYGIHPVRHALQHSPEDILEFWVKKDWRTRGISELRALAARHGIAIQEVPAGTLEKLVGDVSHQGVVLRRRAPRVRDEGDLKSILSERGEKPCLILVLDGVQDPHNLGACLRTAEAAQVDAVVVPVHRGAGLTPTVRKVASGAAESVPLISVRNLARSIREIKEAGVWLVGTTDDSSKVLYDLDLTRPTALVLGSEDRGLRRLTREHCDVLVRIPLQGDVESLNVSVASGICLFEALRQRRG